jgi:hypothetical protein
MIEFKQGLDPYTTMNIGSTRIINVGDIFFAKEKLRWDYDVGFWIKNDFDHISQIELGISYTVSQVNVPLNVHNNIILGIKFNCGLWMSYEQMKTKCFRKIES